MPTTEAEWTLDTNVLVYATAVDAPPGKQRVALDLMERLFRHPQACLAGQVLGEFLSVVLRRQTMPARMALDAVSTWAQAARVLDASAHAYEQAWKLAALHQYQVWDALIIAICAEHGIKTLYTEDAGSLKRPLGVHIVNPFAEPEIRPNPSP